MISKKAFLEALDLIGGDTVSLEEIRELIERLGGERAKPKRTKADPSTAAELKSLRRWLTHARVPPARIDKEIVKRAFALRS